MYTVQKQAISKPDIAISHPICSQFTNLGLESSLRNLSVPWMPKPF